MKYTTAVKLHKNGTLLKFSNSDNFVVQEGFIWLIDYENRRGMIEVPRGFETDLASIPPLFRGFISRNKYVAYILHDYLYSVRGDVKYRTLSRKECDEVMREALRVEGCGMISRWLQYFAVRVGGKQYFTYL